MARKSYKSKKRSIWYYARKYNLERPSLKGVEKKEITRIYNKLVREVNKRSKEKARDRIIDRLQKKLDYKNEQLRKRKIYSQIVNVRVKDVKPAKITSVKKFIEGMRTKKLRKEELSSYHEQGKKLFLTATKGEKLPRPKKNETLNEYTGGLENLRRHRAGLLSAQDELYYHNFLVAAARVGAVKLLRDAQTKGFPYVKALLFKGFDIAEVYLGFESDMDDENSGSFADSLYSDKELEAMGFSKYNPTNQDHKIKYTKYGKELNTFIKSLRIRP